MQGWDSQGTPPGRIAAHRPPAIRPAGHPEHRAPRVPVPLPAPRRTANSPAIRVSWSCLPAKSVYPSSGNRPATEAITADADALVADPDPVVRR